MGAEIWRTCVGHWGIWSETESGALPATVEWEGGLCASMWRNSYGVGALWVGRMSEGCGSCQAILFPKTEIGWRWAGRHGGVGEEEML